MCANERSGTMAWEWDHDWIRDEMARRAPDELARLEDLPWWAQEHALERIGDRLFEEMERLLIYGDPREQDEPANETVGLVGWDRGPLAELEQEAREQEGTAREQDPREQDENVS